MAHLVRVVVLIELLSSSRATSTAPAPPTSPSPFGPPPFPPLPPSPPPPPRSPPPQLPPRSPPPPPPPCSPPPEAPPPLAPFPTGEITFLDLPYLEDKRASWWKCLWPGPSPPPPRPLRPNTSPWPRSTAMDGTNGAFGPNGPMPMLACSCYTTHPNRPVSAEAWWCMHGIHIAFALYTHVSGLAESALAPGGAASPPCRVQAAPPAAPFSAQQAPGLNRTLTRPLS